MSKQDKDFRKKAVKLTVSIQLGKNGLDETQIAEIINQLKKKKLIKVKMLKSFVEGKSRKELIKNILNRTDSELVYNTGFVIGLRKK